MQKFRNIAIGAVALTTLAGIAPVQALADTTTPSPTPTATATPTPTATPSTDQNSQGNQNDDDHVTLDDILCHYFHICRG